MPARRLFVHEGRLDGELSLQRDEIARDHRFHRLLEPRHRTVRRRVGGEARQRIPVLEEVLAGDEQHRVVQGELRGAHVGEPEITEARVHPLESPGSGLVAGEERVERQLRLSEVLTESGVERERVEVERCHSIARRRHDGSTAEVRGDEGTGKRGLDASGRSP